LGQSTPDAPDPAEAYKSGIITYLTYLPDLLKAEAVARQQYDPERIRQQQTLQDEFGPNQYRQQLEALGMLDPESTAVRRQLAGRVSGDLESGYRLPEEYSREVTNSVRGAQAARGNILGDSASAAESAVKGQAGMDAYYRRLGAAGTFLSSPTPIQQLAGVQGVTADRTSAYTSPSAGYAGQNFALQNYANQLNQNANQGGGWTGALGGAAQGAMYGGQSGSGWGALLGGIAGGAAGYFSDRRLKKDIQEVGEMNGFKLYDFRFISDPDQRLCRGVMADEVQSVRPDAVEEENGWLKVNYQMLGIPFVEVG
jgi:hypothetical protein